MSTFDHPGPEHRGRTLTLGEAADLVDGALRGPADHPVEGVAAVDRAGPRELAFLASRRYRTEVAGRGDGPWLVSADLEDELPAGAWAVVAADAHAALQILLDHFHPAAPPAAGVHPTAVLGRGVRLGAGVYVGPYAVLEEDVVLGDGVRVGAHTVVGRGSRIGDGTVLHPQVTLYAGVTVGARCVVHSGARLGSDGFGFVFRDGAHRKIPQVGGCVVGDDVEIGANTCLDRGSLGDTVVGDGVKLDNLVQVAHNVRVGSRSLMAALSGVAGSTRLGEGVWVGGQVGVVNHLEIGDGAQVAFGSILYKDLGPGETVSGHPARPHREELRTRAMTARLPELRARVKALEAEVARLSGAGGGDDDGPGAEAASGAPSS